MENPETKSDSRLKKMRFRSWHRGCKETDLVFGPFSDARLERLTADQLNRYEALLEEQDGDVWAWITGKTPPPADRRYDDLITLLQQFRQTANNAR